MERWTLAATAFLESNNWWFITTSQRTLYVSIHLLASIMYFTYLNHSVAPHEVLHTTSSIHWHFSERPWYCRLHGFRHSVVSFSFSDTSDTLSVCLSTCSYYLRSTPLLEPDAFIESNGGSVVVALRKQACIPSNHIHCHPICMILLLYLLLPRFFMLVWRSWIGHLIHIHQFITIISTHQQTTAWRVNLDPTTPPLPSRQYSPSRNT